MSDPSTPTGTGAASALLETRGEGFGEQAAKDVRTCAPLFFGDSVDFGECVGAESDGHVVSGRHDESVAQRSTVSHKRATLSHMKSYPKCHLCRSRFSSEAALSLHIERLPSASALAYGSLPCEGTRTDGRICRRRTRVQYEWPDTTAAPIGVRAHKAALARARYQRKKNLAHPDFQVEWGNQ